MATFGAKSAGIVITACCRRFLLLFFRCLGIHVKSTTGIHSMQRIGASGADDIKKYWTNGRTRGKKKKVRCSSQLKTSTPDMTEIWSSNGR